jgi:RNA polymerase sigma-70 factor (ECF subfamily)
MEAIAATTRPHSQPDAVAAGLDEAAFSEFYRRTSRPLWSYVYRVTGHAADADDIVQEAFLRLLRAEPGATETEWRRYLYRIASNLVVDRWRARKRQRDEPITDAVLTIDGVDDVDVARTFAELAPNDRALLWLAYVEGETHEEMATSLGVGRRSVKVLLFRARRRLRDLLKARGLS